MGFFTDFDPNKTVSELLPTTKKAGAPEKSKYLVEIVEPIVSFGTNTDNPYVHFSVKVVEPAEFKNRRIFTNLFVKGKDDDSTTAVMENTGRALVAILGEIPADIKALSDYEELAERIAEVIDGKRVVARVGVEHPKKGDEDKYDDKNKITRYFPADTWGAVHSNGASAASAL